jgi:hypothetical protein
MKHNDHPNWKNLDGNGKARVRLENYRKRDLKKRIEDMERMISEDKKKGVATSNLEGLLRRDKAALDGNPLYKGDPTENFMENIRNLCKDYEQNIKNGVG